MSEEKSLKHEERRQEFEKLFENVDETERKLVDRLIGEAVYAEEQMEALKKLPQIAVNPKNPALQKVTAAARLYKEYASSYRDTIRILLNVLRKVESSAQDELLRRLEEFS